MKEFDDMANDLKGKLKSLQTFQNQSFANLSVEVQNKVKSANLDFNKAMRAAQNGDLKELTRLANKIDNADTN